MIFTRNPFPFITPHHLHGSSRLLNRGHLLDKPRTIPLTSQAPAATMATAFPRLGWIPSQVRFGTRLGSLGIFRDCHRCHPHSCFLRGFLSAFPIAQPRSHLVEGGDPAWWSIQFLLDKWVSLLAVLFVCLFVFFHRKNCSRQASLFMTHRISFPSTRAVCELGYLQPVGRGGMGGDGDQTPFSAQPASLTEWKSKKEQCFPSHGLFSSPLYKLKSWKGPAFSSIN